MTAEAQRQTVSETAAMSGPKKAPREYRDTHVSVPEDDVVFRLAQLLLLLKVMNDAPANAKATVERLSIYDFLSANPFLVVRDESDRDYSKLLMAGFDSRAISYASPAQRFTSRRERIQHDLALLIAYGLAHAKVAGGVHYSLTPSGLDMAQKFTAMYADSYTRSASIVVARLRKLSDLKLREEVRRLLGVGIRPEAAEANRADMLDLIDLQLSEGELLLLSLQLDLSGNEAGE